MSRPLSGRERDKLADEISGLQSLGIEQLKAHWRTLYKTEAPARFSRDLLIGAVAYRMQERALGGLKPATRRLFERVVGDAQARRPLKLGPMRKLEPGALLIREWGGVQHRVMVRASGFSFGGMEYRSLSEVARVITGTRWSGPLFFGLKQRAQAEGGDEPD